MYRFHILHNHQENNNS